MECEHRQTFREKECVRLIRQCRTKMKIQNQHKEKALFSRVSDLVKSKDQELCRQYLVRTSRAVPDPRCVAVVCAVSCLGACAFAIYLFYQGKGG